MGVPRAVPTWKGRNVFLAKESSDLNRHRRAIACGNLCSSPYHMFALDELFSLWQRLRPRHGNEDLGWEKNANRSFLFVLNHIIEWWRTTLNIFFFPFTDNFIDCIIHFCWLLFLLLLCWFILDANIFSPKAGVSSCNSNKTRPLKNCPGKKSKFVLSKRIRNFINFRGIFVDLSNLDVSQIPQRLSPFKKKYQLPPVEYLIKSCTLNSI